MKPEDKSGRWSVTYQEETWPIFKTWKTKKEALAAAPAHLALNICEKFYIGQLVRPNLPSIDGESVIEDLICNHPDYSSEAAEGTFEASKEELSDLTQRLSKTFEDWVRIHRLEPTFYLIQNVTEHITEFPLEEDSES
ncbi:hypothetical protein KOR42_10680 [Thalassoglobus neptunius]|uniref:Uncharacterized protein n=1 Tax=Thalassoglobus neptunius TaxID=1938619 RepID=A0A5C5X411_9PLAN|nr:hypothetical protein [Thalassoglobus neptunius]TWT57704.1 hypothetical protein KOR42_10680 [Thalassoglobus neptunius]